MIKMVLPAATAAAVIWLFRHQKISGVFFLILIISTAAAGVVVFREIREGDWETVKSVRRTSGEAAGEQVELAVASGRGEKEEITIEIPQQSYSSQEAEAEIRKEMQALDERVLGKNADFGRIEWNLELPENFTNPSMTVEWSTNRPDLVSWEGVLSPEVPEGGEKVTLTGRLSLSGKEEEYQRVMTVYPSREKEAVQERIQKESEVLNERAAKNGRDLSEEYLLPERANGEKLTWYRKISHKGAYLCMIILLVGIAPFFAGKDRKEKAEQKRRKLLTNQYPELVSKLQLLTAAGLSVRKAMERLGREYREVGITVAEMNNGVYEQDALTHFGERCGTPEYRKLALLLAQSQKKGGSQLSGMLEKEVQEAFETRKRRARAEGDRAAIRMVFPMFVMLGIVLLIIIIPATMQL